jgi:hypothetical protein
VRQADAVVIAVGGDENLRFMAQTSERNRVDDPVAVALIRAARTAGDRAFQREFTAKGLRWVTGQGDRGIGLG